MDFFRDSAWDFVGALLAFIAIGISIYLFLAQRRRKKLSYEEINISSLLSVAEEVEGKLQILYENEPVRGVHLIELSFINTGNVPILESDFNRPVKVEFGEEAKILSAEISEVIPENLDAKIDDVDHTIKLIPTLLNSGDTIKIKSLVSEFDGEYRIEGRIVGVKNIEKREKGGFFPRISRFGLVLTIICGILLLIFSPEKETSLYVLLNSAFYLGMVIAFVASFIMDIKK